MLRVRPRVKDAAGWIGEQPVTVLPQLMGSLALPFLLGLVLAQQLNEFGWEPDPPATSA